MSTKQRYFTVWPIFTGFFFIVLFILSGALIMYQSRTYMDPLIANDVAYLKEIFQRIDATAGIRDFEYDKNPINFLNVGHFAGSEVGPMNLRYPEKWQGPYVQDNPTMQEKEYQIVHTPAGYFIAPGDGAYLSDGSIIGADIILNKNTDFLTLLAPGGALRSADGSLLAVQLQLGAKPEIGNQLKKRFPSTDVLVEVAHAE